MMLVKEGLEIMGKFELRMGTSCGSCIHTNKPKKPREHAAHYEVAKTERWCFLHDKHVTRETTCDDHEGVSRAAKTAYTRTKKYNERILVAKKVIKLLEEYGKPLVHNGYVYFIENNWIKYIYGDDVSDIEKSHWVRSLSTKEGSTDRILESIINRLGE